MSTAEQAIIGQVDSKTDDGMVLEAARSLKWSLMYNIVPRTVTPFSTMILAALLTPADFGLVAISTFVLALSRILVDLGLSKAVIQRRTGIREAASVSLWVCLTVSSGVYVFLWATAPYIAHLYKNPLVTGVIRVAALSLPVTALGAIPKALLRRELSFRSLFWVNSSFLIVQAVASVILAALGARFWALIVGQLLGLAVSTTLAWTFSHLRPSFLINMSVLRSLLGFSFWVMVSSFQNWLFSYADNAIAGLFLGVQGLGIYALGLSISTLVPGLLEVSIGDVAYPTFCRLQRDRHEVGRNLVKLQGLTAALVFPLAAGISAMGPTAIRLLYGEKWQGLGGVLAILVVMPGLGCIWALNENAYQAVGRPDIWTKLSSVALVALLPLLWKAAPYGLGPFTLARFGGAWLLPLGNVFFGSRVLGIGLKDQIKGFAAPFWISVVMFGALSVVRVHFDPFVGIVGWAKLVSISFAGGCLYLTLIWRFERNLWTQLVMNVRRVVS